MKAEQFAASLKRNGITLCVGVPCSFINRLTVILQEDVEFIYVADVREDNAVGIAVGAYLGGEKPLVFLQNSAIGTCMNALCSLAVPYRIPILLLITWRGSENDGPEHLLMGKMTPSLLDSISIPYLVLTENGDRDISEACAVMERSSGPVALLIKEGGIS